MANSRRDYNYHGPFDMQPDADQWAEQQENIHKAQMRGDPDRPSIRYTVRCLLPC